LNCALLDLVC
ncbi:response regulator, partial [Vibrio harveyi]